MDGFKPFNLKDWHITLILALGIIGICTVVYRIVWGIIWLFNHLNITVTP